MSHYAKLTLAYKTAQKKVHYSVSQKGAAFIFTKVYFWYVLTNAKN